MLLSCDSHYSSSSDRNSIENLAPLNSCFKWIFGKRVRYILLGPLALVVVPLAALAAAAALAVCLALAVVFLPVFLVGILPCIVATKCRRVVKRR